MNSIESELEEEIKRLTFKMTNESVSVKFLQEFSGFSFEGVKIPLSPRGARINVPYFVAKFLLDKGVIEDFREEYPLSLQNLTNAVRNEIRSGDLQPIHPFFQLLMKENILSELSTDSQFSELELKRQRAKFQQLNKERISKLVKMVDNKEILNKKRSDLTESEKILFHRIASWVQYWNNMFTS